MTAASQPGDPGQAETLPPGQLRSPAAVHQPADFPRQQADPLELIAFRAFPRQVCATRQARRFVADAIGLHPARETAELLAAELIANAVVHAGQGNAVSVAVAVNAACIRIEVSDSGQWGIPRRRSPGNDEECGRGLQLVNQLALRWGFTREPGRTCCWAEIAADG
jgi:anti-sigma regulatory factor (Ser/Thr protein kinase)